MALDGKTRELELEPTEEIDNNSLNLQNLLKLLKCPVCWTICEPENIIQCYNGHYGCRSCFTKLTTCPMCRVTLESEIQTFAQETLHLVTKELRHMEDPRARLSPEAIAKIFQCLRCKVTPTTVPVLQCRKGHVFCSLCRSFIQICVHGQHDSKDQFIIRSLMVQELLNFVPKPCRFRKHGCSEKIAALSHHETNCQYSEIYCLVPYCFARVSLPKVVSHILKGCEHTPIFLDNFDTDTFSSLHCGSISVPLLSEEEMKNHKMFDHAQVSLLKLGDSKHFLLFYCPNMLSLNVHFITYFIGVPEEASKYSYTLKLSSYRGGPSIHRKGNVISACCSKSLYFSHLDVIRISFEDIQKASSVSSRNFKFNFEVNVFEK